MANKPVVANNKPAKVNLSADQEYYFCVCGRSQNQPFCDGSHAGTGICSGGGGMLPEEQQANSRYLFELGSAGFGYDETIPEKVQAFHFKGGQAAKTGTGGHLPGAKVSKKIAGVRGIPEGESAYSPPTFADLREPADFKRFADRVREISGGIPVGFKLSANQAIGCVAARICHTNQCPSGVATQDPQLRKRLDVDDGAHRLARFLQSSMRLMQVMARACGHERLDQFNQKDLATSDYEMARLSGIVYAGMAAQP